MAQASFKTASDVPATKTTTTFRHVKYIQVHDSFTPLQMAPMMSLSMSGHNPMLEMVERPHGIYVRCMGKVKDVMTEREFLVPYGNISHYEYVTEA